MVPLRGITSINWKRFEQITSSPGGPSEETQSTKRDQMSQDTQPTKDVPAPVHDRCSPSTFNPLTDSDAALSSWLLVELSEIRASKLCGSGHSALESLRDWTKADFLTDALHEWLCDEDHWDRDEEGEWFRWRFNPTGGWEIQLIRVLS